MKSLKTPFLMFFLLFAFSSNLHAAGKTPKYDLSIVCIFNNEAEYLKEWIEYHRLVGTDHFYLYNNNSSDNYEEVLKPYIESGVVTLINWPSPPHILYVFFQKEAYNHCVKTYKYDSHWMAFIDTDEFIVPTKDSTIPEFLEGYKLYGGVFINWQCFGTSHMPSVPVSRLMIESLTLKYPWDHPKNRIVKTIAQPTKINEYFIHDCSFKKGSFGVTPGYLKGKSPFPDIEKIRINHYWTRAEDFFFNVKIPRVESYTKKTMSQEEIEKILIESNSIEDLSIFPYVEDLRKAMDNE